MCLADGSRHPPFIKEVETTSESDLMPWTTLYPNNLEPVIITTTSTTESNFDNETVFPHLARCEYPQLVGKKRALEQKFLPT